MDQKIRQLERRVAAGDTEAQAELDRLNKKILNEEPKPQITRAQIWEVLIGPEEYKGQHSLRDTSLNITELTSFPNSIEISASAMYEHPVSREVNIEFLCALSELFKTKKIDVDDWANGGCETCDYGSSYGHSFQIYEAGVDLSLLLEQA